MPLIDGDTAAIQQIKESVDSARGTLQKPTVKEVEDAGTFLRAARGFLRGVDVESLDVLHPIRNAWLPKASGLIWQSYVGPVLFGSVLNLYSLENAMRLAYVIIFAGRNEMVWSIEDLLEQ